MTGRDLILYILQNHLEDTPIFENGKIIGFMTVGEAAEKFKVGTETIRLWVRLGYMYGVDVHGDLYIPIDAKVKEPI